MEKYLIRNGLIWQARISPNLARSIGTILRKIKPPRAGLSRRRVDPRRRERETTMAMPADISDFASTGAVKSPAARAVRRLAALAAIALLPWAGIAVLVRLL
jgi:hypothetical protein